MPGDCDGRYGQGYEPPRSAQRLPGPRRGVAVDLPGRPRGPPVVAVLPVAPQGRAVPDDPADDPFNRGAASGRGGPPGRRGANQAAQGLPGLPDLGTPPG